MTSILADIQNTPSNHNIYLENVGITDLKLPIKILQKDNNFQSSIATISCYVDLAADVKGISMSRLLEVLHEYTYKPLNIDIIQDVTKVIRARSKSDKCRLEIEFPYFMEKTAPVSLKKGYVHHLIKFKCTNNLDVMDIKFETTVVVTSLCPCSKEISVSSAHNQKCYVTVEYMTDSWVWVETIITEVEKCGSSEIYSILKRPDEKVVTERAYNNPLFVEDIARNVYTTLENISGVTSFKVSVVSDESIHLHKAIAIASKS